MSYLLAFLGFVLLIVLHEAGHFVAAKAVGMRVERFSLFFGPMFARRRIGETDYGIGVLPLGGYVKITGMSPEEVFDTPEIAARAYVNQPPWKRIVVILAGPVVNLVVAFLLFWVVFGYSYHYVTTPSGAVIAGNTIGFVQHGSPAYGVLRPGDQLVSVDGIRSSSGSIRAQISRHACAGGARINGCRAAAAATIVVRREHRLLTLRIRPRWNSRAAEMMIGIGFDARIAHYGVIAAAGRSVTWMGHVTGKTVSVIAQLFKSQDRRKLHSVVGTYQLASQQISLGWLNGVQVFALISLALALMNLFPFLPLDGGHIFWAVAEKIRGRRVPLQVMERASLIGIGLLAILFVIGLTNDVSSLAGNGIHAQ
jgi:regulator of sigma E protease